MGMCCPFELRAVEQLLMHGETGTAARRATLDFPRNFRDQRIALQREDILRSRWPLVSSRCFVQTSIVMSRGHCYSLLRKLSRCLLATWQTPRCSPLFFFAENLGYGSSFACLWWPPWDLISIIPVACAVADAGAKASAAPIQFNPKHPYPRPLRRHRSPDSHVAPPSSPPVKTRNKY
jgi:hypothetical protein